ncbi:MAG: site-specific integrase, partial [Bryobacteraceae bacterium]
MPECEGGASQIERFEREAEIARLERERARYCQATLAQNSLKSYEDSWKRFTAWCEETARTALPATEETVALWATASLEHLKVSTVELRVCGVAWAHRKAGYSSPTRGLVRRVLSGARRIRREAPAQKRAITAGELWKISRLMDPATAIGLRDRALFVLGFASAFRRSELSLLDLEDVSFVAKGLLLQLRHSKTDQLGRGRHVGIERGEKPDTCPVRTLKAWITSRGDHPGPLFRQIRTGTGDILDKRLSTEGIARAIKRGVGRIGLNAHLYA